MGSHGSWKATAAAIAIALALPAAAVAGVRSAESVLPPGQSGYVPPEGQPDNPHLTDQVALFESFAFKPAGFDQPGAVETPRAGITITRDAYGVPNVRAGSAGDAWFGVGYAVAQDRLVELELFRRSTQGRLAEVLGESRLESDIVARRDYYTPKELRAQLAKLPASLRARFDAYADGVNAWIARVAADPSVRPREFALLNLTPAPWTELDSAAIGVQLARTVPSDDGHELDNWRALRALGAQALRPLPPAAAGGHADHGARLQGALPVAARPQPLRREEGLQGVAEVPQGPQAAEGRGGGRACRRPAACAGRLVPLRDPRRRQHGIAVLRAAAGLLDPRAVRRVRGPRARPERARRHRPGHPGRRGRPQRSHRLGHHERPRRRRRPLRREARRQGALPLQGQDPQDVLPQRDVQGLGREVGQEALLPDRARAGAADAGQARLRAPLRDLGPRDADVRRARRAQRGEHGAAGRQRRGEADLEREPAGRRRRRPHRLVASRPAAAAPEALGRAAALPRHRRGRVARSAQRSSSARR